MPELTMDYVAQQKQQLLKGNQELDNRKRQLLEELEQLNNTIQANGGAIQACDLFINHMNEVTETEDIEEVDNAPEDA